MVDPFAGSCATGEAAERTDREWLCCDLVEEYLSGAIGRFKPNLNGKVKSDKTAKEQEDSSYRIYKPGAMWKTAEHEPLPADGGAKRQPSTRKPVARAPAATYPPPPRSSQMALLEDHKIHSPANGAEKKINAKRISSMR